MPHYSDGTEAKAGDIARGQPYNTKRVVEGAVIRVTPDSETCNLVIAFPNVVLSGNLLSGLAIAGTDQVAVLSYDYGECKAFELVKRNGQ